MSVEDFILYVYCCVEDICRTIVNQPLRIREAMPKLSDAEAITMEIVGEFMGKDHDKGTWRYFRIGKMQIYPQQNNKLEHSD